MPILLKSALLITAGLAVLSAASAPTQTSAAITVPLPYDRILPTYAAGAMYQVTRAQVTLFAPVTDNAPVSYSVEAAHPGSVVSAVAADRNTGAVIAVGWRSAGWAGNGGIDLIDRSGRLTQTIPTGPYLPTHIAFAQDGTLWAFGVRPDLRNAAGQEQDHAVVRHYSPQGALLLESLKRSTFLFGLSPAQMGNQWNGIQVTSQRIGILAINGMSSATTQWVELNPATGEETGRWNIDSQECPNVTMTEDGSVYFQSNNLDTMRKLDRTTGVWNPVSFPKKQMLLGADGNQLVYLDWATGQYRLHWYPQP